MRLMLLALQLNLPALASEATAPALSGAWGLEIAAVSAARVPVLGDLKSTSRTWILLELRDAGGPAAGSTLDQRHRVCAAEVRGGLVRTRIPRAYVDAIVPKHYPAIVQQDGQGWLYDADTRPYQVGVRADCAAVPTQADDPCVEDTDSDGKPGATVHAKAPAFPWVEVYVAQRAHPVLSGRVVDVDHVEGAVAFRALQTEVLGASNRLFASSPTVRPLDQESRFRMERLSGSGDCQEVLERFGADPPAD